MAAVGLVGYAVVAGSSATTADDGTVAGQQQAAQLSTQLPEPRLAPAEWERPGTPRRVRIPRLDVDARVLPVKAQGDTFIPPSDPAELGWWAEGVRPGEPGRALVAGSYATVACRLVRGGTLTFAVHREPEITTWKELQPLMEAVGRAAGHDLMPGTRVEVEWRGSWFAARIRDARGGSYYVDFDDKDEGWNQWVPRERVRRR